MDKYHWKLEVQKGFDPNQPRWPAGMPWGGQWRSLGGQGSEVLDFGTNWGKASDWGRESSRRWTKTVTKEEKDAIFRYTASGWYSINRILRGKNREDDFNLDFRGDKQKLDSALSRSTIPSNVKAYRGMCKGDKCAERISQLQPGDTFTDKGYTSTSLVANIAFRKRVMVNITVPKGTKAAYIDHLSENKGEYELLIARNSTFRVDAVRREGELIDLDVTLIGQGE